MVSFKKTFKNKLISKFTKLKSLLSDEGRNREINSIETKFLEMKEKSFRDIFKKLIKDEDNYSANSFNETRKKLKEQIPIIRLGISKDNITIHSCNLINLLRNKRDISNLNTYTYDIVCLQNVTNEYFKIFNGSLHNHNFNQFMNTYKLVCYSEYYGKLHNCIFVKKGSVFNNKIFNTTSNLTTPTQSQLSIEGIDVNNKLTNNLDLNIHYVKSGISSKNIDDFKAHNQTKYTQLTTTTKALSMTKLQNIEPNKEEKTYIIEKTTAANADDKKFYILKASSIWK